MKMHRAETLAAALTAIVFALALSLSAVRGFRIDFASFAMPFVVAAAMVLVAGYYRASGRSHNIALAMASCAVFILFTNSGAALNYALLPTTSPVIDDLLYRIDAAIGFDWASFSGWVANYPSASFFLRWVYQSSLPQLALVILLLSFTGRQVEVHRFMTVGILASCLSLLVWTLWPSFGPSTFVQLDPAIDARLGRVVNAEYGRRLLDLSRHGPAIISGEGMMGLIAFPSMHTVMAAMTVWFTRRTTAFWPCLALNSAMLPAIVVHGGHHLVDIIAGAMVFAAALWAAYRVVPRRTDLQSSPDRPDAVSAGPPVATFSDEHGLTMAQGELGSAT